MIIPRYWADARVQKKTPENRQITVRRFGWSNESEGDAQTRAQVRADEAMERILRGEKLLRREPRVPYNGADGVPIREEIVEEHGETVITRNSYGARCLNTPNVLFADVDAKTEPNFAGCCIVTIVLWGAAAWLGWHTGRGGVAFFCAVAASWLTYGLTVLLHKARLKVRGGVVAIAAQRIAEFRRTHPHWRIRCYRTPGGGFRLLVTHALFDPRSDEVAGFFSAIGVDPLYANMCRAQNCFRARLTAKPWRMGPDMVPLSHVSRAVWPLQPEVLAGRGTWVREYENAAGGYAACHFIDETGDTPPIRAALAVQRLHDEQCRAESGLPLA